MKTQITAGGCLLAVSLVGISIVTTGVPQEVRIPSGVINQPGQYVSRDGKCHASLEIASMGGFWILTVGVP